MRGINRLTNLEVLNISNTTINDAEISNLYKLKSLNIEENCDIKQLNNFTNIKKLNIGSSNVKLHQIDKLDLFNIDISNNHNISDLNIFTNLTKLVAYGSYLNEDAIEKCINLKVIKIGTHCPNCNINSVKNQTNLIELHASEKLTQDGILYCKQLKKLSVECNKNIKDINHLTNLKKLTCFRSSAIYQEGIEKCTKLKSLDHFYNENITDVRFLKKLTYLRTTLNCKFNESIEYINVIN